MNGTAQTTDLVRCLAMVAQNELGSSAPAEAYKAQCVATHCWILSRSRATPSVLGAEPGAAALAAAQEVAHVLVTYNGQVCFTPYFASASTGTASAAEVWGNAPRLAAGRGQPLRPADRHQLEHQRQLAAARPASPARRCRIASKKRSWTLNTFRRGPQQLGSPSNPPTNS